MARSNFALASAGLLVLLAAAGCTAHKTAIPALTGPSDVVTSISVSVNPDTIFQDGASKALVTVKAFDDSNGRPKTGLTLRAEITVNNVMTDFGTLSARNIVTDSTGTAPLTSTPPPPSPPPRPDSTTAMPFRRASPPSGSSRPVLSVRRRAP